MNLLHLALQSAWSRKGNLLLAILSIAISVTLLLGVDIVRKETKNQFLNTVSQTDLIVGARSGPVNLLLYSIFHIGNATNNIQYRSYQTIQKMAEVAWTVPISLGDSHKGYRVIGTEKDFYQHVKYGDASGLNFAEGKAFSDLYDVVIGAEVARKLHYKIGDKIILSHGVSLQNSPKHADKPFTISGILKSTGTPIDKSLQVSLRAIEAIHIDWQGGRQSPLKINAQLAQKLAPAPKEITAMLVGLKSPVYTFKLQRRINELPQEPLLAILPGATLTDLWQTIGIFEKVLLSVSVLVLFAALIGMLITLLSTLNERRHEMAVLRAIGIHTIDIFKLFTFEALLIMLSGILVGLGLLYGLFFLLNPMATEILGIFLTLPVLDEQQWIFIGMALGIAVMMGLIPGYFAYRQSLQDGLMVRH